MDHLRNRCETDVENHAPSNLALDRAPEVKELSIEELVNIVGYDRGVTLDW
jgi:hypothetical protein